VEKPASYDEDLMTDWSLCVLDHGLPDMPAAVAVGESVPVARWAGPRLGAVLHLQWSWSHDHENDYLATQIEVFRRTADASWDVANIIGGSDWPPDWPLRRRNVTPDYAYFSGQLCFREGSWCSCVFDGTVGVNAVYLEVLDVDGTTRFPIDSPLRVVLAAVDGNKPARIRVLTSDGQVLATRDFDGWE
jgi:hypothetical protein